jgi:hypothetical protein
LNGPLCNGPVVDRSAMPVRACCSTTEVLFANPLARSTGPALRRPPSGMGIWKELFALANARPVRCFCVLVDGGRGWFAVQVRLIRLLSRRQSIHRLITPAVGDTREGVKITWLGVLEAGVVQDVEELGAPRLRATHTRRCSIGSHCREGQRTPIALQVLMWALDWARCGNDQKLKRPPTVGAKLLLWR